MKYYSITFNNPLAHFITSFKNDSDKNILLRLSRDADVYNVIPDISRFYIVDESKEWIRNIDEINIRNGSVIIDDDVILPFMTTEDDIYSVYDMYTIVDSENIYSGLEYNFFYNPLISNYKKACVFNDIINNEKLVYIKNNKYIIEETILIMFRRFRLASYIENNYINYIMLDFDIPDDIISSNINYDVVSMINFKDCGVTNIIENDIDSGDFDNSSRISVSIISCKNNKCSFDSIEESIPEDDEFISEEEYEDSEESEEESEEEESLYGNIGAVSCEGFTDNEKRRMFVLWELAQYDEWRDVIINSPEFKKYAKEFISNVRMTNEIYENVLKKILSAEIPMNTKKFKNDGHGYLFNTFRLQDNITELYEFFDDKDNRDDIVNIYNIIVSDPGRINITNDYFDNYYSNDFVEWVMDE
ncbi:MAG: hypothetical protein IJ997_03935 [Mycoplasmataceae bacterium]|nr:hypothetical protein [Mycoplasmataceae bacterium]